MISRRTIFRSTFLASLATVFAGRAPASETPSAGPLASARQKVVYHLADTEKAAFALGNIRNHIDGMGGPDKVDIVLVVHGSALTLFRQRKAHPKLEKQVEAIVAHGVQLAACGNTMRAQDIELADLLPGFVRADEGGVVRIAQLQVDGYAYIRP